MDDPRQVDEGHGRSHGFIVLWFEDHRVNATLRLDKKWTEVNQTGARMYITIDCFGSGIDGDH